MYYYIMREKGEGRPKESAVFLTELDARLVLIF